MRGGGVKRSDDPTRMTSAATIDCIVLYWWFPDRRVFDREAFTGDVFANGRDDPWQCNLGRIQKKTESGRTRPLATHPGVFPTYEDRFSIWFDFNLIPDTVVRIHRIRLLQVFENQQPIQITSTKRERELFKNIKSKSHRGRLRWLPLKKPKPRFTRVVFKLFPLSLTRFHGKNELSRLVYRRHLRLSHNLTIDDEQRTSLQFYLHFLHVLGRLHLYALF